MNAMSLKTIVENALRPGYLPVIAGKVWTRLAEPSRWRARTRARAWCQEHREDAEAYARALDVGLWEESVAFAVELAAFAERRLKEVDAPLGGGGFVEFIYFLTRHLRPTTVVETGVAAGFTSCAILEALVRNDGGRLYSSDFPYFRLRAPEQYIGLLVEDHLKERWELFTMGDRENLRQITRKVDHIDIFHYDSDKSYRGRRLALGLVEKHLRPGSAIVMDDIDDNLFFRDFVRNSAHRHHVFACGGKYVGVVFV